MISARSIRFVLFLALATVAPTRPAAAARPFTRTITQTVRTLSQDQNGIRGDYYVTYSALTLRSSDWSLRGSMSWLSWRDGGGDISTLDDSGPGSIYLTGGRRLWVSRSRGGGGSGWLRLRAKVPLQSEFDMTGSSEFDAGASLFSAYRFGFWTVLGEAGIMNLGEPVGFEYDALFSGSLSVSYRRHGSSFYPLVGYSASSAARAGDSSYGEWTLGVGSLVSRGISVSALFSRGTTDISPENGIAISVSLRL